MHEIKTADTMQNTKEGLARFLVNEVDQGTYLIVEHIEEGDSLPFNAIALLEFVIDSREAGLQELDYRTRTTGQRHTFPLYDPNIQSEGLGFKVRAATQVGSLDEK